jgi:large subunit ribosomal protein L3
MLPGLLSKKLGMSQIFRDDGTVVPVTVLLTGGCTVLQVKTTKTDGYNAVQVGFETRKKKNTPRAIIGHIRQSKLDNPPRYIREFRLPDGEAGEKQAEGFKIGERINVDVFENVYKVTVCGTTKGRGFMGMVKRWNKHRGPESHGSMLVRGPGSVGSDVRLTHIRPGKHMPGHYGVEKVTVENLEVIKLDKNRNLLYVRGAVPGPKNGLVTIYKTNLVKKAPIVVPKGRAKKQEPRTAHKK